MHNAGMGGGPMRQKGLEEALARRGAAPQNTAHVSKAPSLLLDMLSSAQRCVLSVSEPGARSCGAASRVAPGH